MPHSAFKLVPGVDTQETPALNESSGISATNLVRFFPDRNGLGLVQKLGGWTKFYPTPMAAPVRALWAWEDLNLNQHLAVGVETIPASSSAQLGVITSGIFKDVTPRQIEEDIAAVVSATLGSSIVTITDNNTTGITNYDSVYIATQISIGGLVLFGLYPCDPDGILSGTSFDVQALDKLGKPQAATSTSSLPVLPSFKTTGPNPPAGGSTTVTVTLPNYPYAAGDTFAVLVPTSVGGITLYGNYVVQTTPSSSQFTIIASQAAQFDDTKTLNGGLARFIFSLGVGSIPAGTGYGIGPYGGGGYGTGTPIVPATGTAIPALDWVLDNFGEILVAVADQGVPPYTTPFQPVYAWSPGEIQATVIPQAPPVNEGVFVAMPERQLVAYGSTVTGIQDPLLVRWTDLGSLSDWTGTPINQAGQFRIPSGSKIVGGLQGPQQGLLWTDIDLWAMQYINLPLVYGFNKIGTGCGLIAKKAAGFYMGAGYWMGYSQFFTLAGDGVQPLPCPVWDQIFQNLDRNHVAKIRFAVNSLFNEVAWYYPSVGGDGDVDSYVKYNVVVGSWDFGSLGRSAWVDQSIFGPPIGADPDSFYIYQHETSNDADGSAMLSSFQTGEYAIAEGDLQTFVDLIWPDMKWGQLSQAQTATVQITFLVKNYPGETARTYGPYSVTQATKFFNTRFRGRLVSIKISSSDLGSFWRIGNLRYRFASDGKF